MTANTNSNTRIILTLVVEIIANGCNWILGWIQSYVYYTSAIVLHWYFDNNNWKEYYYPHYIEDEGTNVDANPDFMFTAENFMIDKDNLVTNAHINVDVDVDANAHIQFISIDGNIGSGKSTLLKNLCEKYSANSHIIFLAEPVKEWSTIRDEEKTILEYFYENQHRYAFTFQIMAYISRVSIMCKAIQDIEKKDPGKIHNWTIISERSILTDKYVFAAMLEDCGKLTPIEMQIYLKWFDEFIDKFSLNGIIYVNTSSDVCLKRIHERLRDGEERIPQEYLVNCEKFHNQFIDKMRQNKNINIVSIDGNQNIKDDPQLVEDWIYLIENTFL